MERDDDPTDGAKVHPDSAALERRYSAPNYQPLDVTLTTGEGVWVTDVEGRRYLDLLAAYSALNFGHRHPRLVAAAAAQLDRLTLTSRAFRHDQLGPFAQELVELVGGQMMLPMNTGAEAVETGIKAARRWGTTVRGVAEGAATIVVCEGNFHGRTTTIVGFSDDPVARDGFGPFAPGFRRVPFGDAAALADALDDTTVAVLLEPIQGEAGVIVPPDGYLTQVRRLCTERGTLLIADEIQSGLGRAGHTLACDHEGVVPDLVLLGKALGGGLLPVSAVVGRADVLEVLGPGSHGSTFGGNPLACAIGREVIAMLGTGELQARSRSLGRRLAAGLRTFLGDGLTEVRSRGLWAGIDLDPSVGSGRRFCEELARLGVLAKDAHGQAVRLAPPLVIAPDEVDLALEAVGTALARLSS